MVAPPGRDPGLPSTSPRPTLRLVLPGGAGSPMPDTQSLRTVPAGKLARGPAHNLPAQLTSIVGRERELADVRRLVAEHRLVTLTGVGGVGKTRLALEVATAVRPCLEHGVWLVELAPLAQPSLVSAAVAAALGVRDEGAAATEPSDDGLVERLVALLRGRRVLLVLDNCEHVLDASASLAGRLLAGCPGLKILATSREPLAITGERAWRVPSLDLPTADAGRWTMDGPESGTHRPSAAVQRLLESGAVRLFLDRAAAASPSFALTAASARSVEAICRRLDGIPLAIELAAARLRGLSVGQVAERLDDRFALLVAGRHAALPRHQTLRAMVDWSYGLLSPAERKLLRRVSVFAGGFSIEAACIMARDGEPDPNPPPNSPTDPIGEPAEDEVVELLARLVEKSLVSLEDRQARARYRLPETIREYAAIRLRESGEEAELRTRYLRWCLALAEAAERRIRTDEHRPWMARLQLEHDNLRAALAWSRTAPADQLGPRLAAALVWFWEVRGYWGEALGYLEEMLARADAVPVRVRARLLNGAGLLWYERGDYRRAVERARQALSVCRELDDPAGVCMALHVLGLVAQFQGNCKRAEALLREALDLAGETGDQVHLAQALYDLGVVAHGGADHARAAELYTRGLARWRRLPYRAKVALSLTMLGRMAHLRGDLAEAARLLQESVAVAREAGSPRALGWALLYSGYLARHRGDVSGAAAAYLDGLHQRTLIGDRRGIAQCLEALASVEGDRAAHGRRTHAELAARLFGAADLLRREIDAPVLPCDRAQHGRDLAFVRRILGPAFDAAWESGRRGVLQDTIDEAVAVAGPRTAGDGAGGGLGTNGAGGGIICISDREREVAALIARGLTSKQIAAELSIAKRTADTHAWNVMTKLGLTSRRQVAAWAVEQGLATAQ